MTPPVRRPALDLAEVVRRHTPKLGDGLSGEQRRILRAIASCRTAALGGHVLTCDRCRCQRIYAKPPFGGPEQVLKYLARYTHRIAFSDARLVSIDDRDVTFTYKDYARGHRRRTMTLDGKEFLRRFLLHAVPGGFVRLRHFGLLANRVREENLATCRRLLGVAATGAAGAIEPADPHVAGGGEPSWRCQECPVCGRGRLVPGPRLSGMELAAVLARLQIGPRMDSS